MPQVSPVLVGLIGLGIGFVVLFVVQMKNVRGVKHRGRRSSSSSSSSSSSGNSQRRTDQRTLSSPEKKLYTQARSLLQEGKAQAGARILEQLNMHREAIQALEDAGQIHDAANTLMRMQKPNRAGVVYARHGMWQDAAKAFKTANMPLEVGKCAREAGDFAMAAEHFEKTGRADDAGECWEKAGDLHRAARSFAQAGNAARSMALYDRLATTSKNLAAVAFLDEEVKAIFEHLTAGNSEPGLAEILMQKNRLPEAIRTLCAKGLLEPAASLVQRSATDVGPKLMAEISYQDGSAQCLAQVFEKTSNHHHAGVVYERLGTFAEAGAAFERAEDFERAAYCYERAGKDDKARPLREKARAQPYQPQAAQSSSAGGFALSSLPSDAPGPIIVTPPPEDASTVPVALRVATPAPIAGPLPGGTTPLVASSAPHSAAAAQPAPPRPRLALPTFDTPTASNGPKFSLSDGDTQSAAQAVPDAPVAAALEATAPPPTAAPQSEAAAPQKAPAPVATAIAVTPTPTPAPLATVPTPTPALAPSVLTPTTAPVAPFSLPTPTAFVPLRVLNQDATPEDLSSLEPAQASFHKAKFLADLDVNQKALLWSIGTSMTYAENQAVLTYNDEPRGVYIITAGVVSCYRVIGGKDTYVDQMGESETFGELWLLADQPSAVRFVATKPDTQIRIIDRDAFNDLMDKDGTLARKVYKRFTMRLLKRLLKPQTQPKNQQAS